MLLSHSLLLPLFAATVSYAWDKNPWASPSTSASNSQHTGGKVHHIQVGPNSQLAFYPDHVTAQPGDQLRFHFNPKNHSVTQSSFEDPCSRVQNGFDSGFRPVAPGSYDSSVYTVDVKDDKPIWVYCKQPLPARHCTQGMVFAANAPSSGDKTFKAFQDKAKALSSSSPGAPPQGTPKVHKVSVGLNGTLTYTNDTIYAEVGDKVLFIFHQKNHTVTQSAFDDPCNPVKDGFDTGFKQFVADDVTSNFPKFEITVKDKKPIWGYCRQTGHCQKGMVFGINPSKPEDVATFKAKALASSSEAPPQGTPQVHKVSVGLNGTLTYTPDQITANPGDTVEFIFHPKNHTVTQSSFDAPCTPFKGGFTSGFNPVDANRMSGFPQFKFKVKDTNPTWVHCEQTGHCSKGMVFSVNAKPGDFEKFKAKATASSTFPPGTSQPTVHKVTVGGSAGNVYTPNQVKAADGDVVIFEFRQKNHTVTESSFNDPCTKLEISSYGAKKGFASGFMPVAPEKTTDFPTFNVTVNGDKPTWVYCGQPGHCQQGMVFAINPGNNSWNSFEAFKSLAIHSNSTKVSASYVSKT